MENIIKILLFVLINLILCTVCLCYTSFADTTVIESVSMGSNSDCQIRTRGGTRFSRSLMLCVFAKYAVNWPIHYESPPYRYDEPAAMFEGTKLIQKLQFANRQNSHWYNSKSPMTTQDYALNGIIDNIYVEGNNCYISIVDNSDRFGNSGKYHRVFSQSLCEIALHAFTNGMPLTANAQVDPVPNYANNILNIQPISNKIKDFFQKTSRNCTRRSYRRKRGLEDEAIHMAILIALYSVFPNVNREQFIPSVTQPLAERFSLAVVSNYQPVQIPLAVRARLTPNRVVPGRNWGMVIIFSC